MLFCYDVGMAKRLKVMPKKPLQISCCLVFDEDSRILLLQRHADDLGGGLWATPGGKQEPGEDPATTAIREVEEETGLKLKNIQYLGKHSLMMPHGVAHMRTYRAYVSQDEKIIINHNEHQGHQWLSVADLLTTEKIIWGLPTTLSDFGLIQLLRIDPTLADGSRAVLLELAN
ncbi:MAG: putative nudix hydrolase [Candidatus Saccharibacteria bacterium]|nr:putative nudix hydrolase [Candidatus Saccharibacteria bacterium]